MILKLTIFGTAILILILLATKKNLFRSRSVYMGNWNGGYSGESDNGAWSILIGGDGKISGTIISLVNRKEYIISGTVDKQGKTEMKSEETPGLFFSGMLNADTAVAFGNWIDTREEPPHGGTWNGMKSFA